MKNVDYPNLYRLADREANIAQRRYFRCIMLQYALLFLSAIVALGPSSSVAVLSTYAGLIIISTLVLAFMSTTKPEKDWYGCRALAESFKTLTWRFSMNAEPFSSGLPAEEVRKALTDRFRAVLDDNAHVRQANRMHSTKGNQVTRVMMDLRALALSDRLSYYISHRIEEQKNWYLSKAKINRVKFNWHVWFIIIVQLIAVLMALLRIKFNDVLVIWPTEPTLVIASAMIGWVQIKKFNELSSAYSLAAHEIGLLQARSDIVQTEKDFSDFINDAEMAFSREHTQWIARQNS